MKIILTYLILIPILISCSKSDDKKDSAADNSTVTDVDGKIYPCVKIQNIYWMAKNLDVSRYRNGDPIPEVKNDSEWASLTTGAWCYAFNDPAKGAIYGKLYNWYAVNDPRGIAPEGWEVPSVDDWISLRNFIGDFNSGKLKEVGVEHWIAPNDEASNIYGFSALPSGLRSYFGEQFPVGFDCYFWSSTSDSFDVSFAINAKLDYTSYMNINAGNKRSGLAVRCSKAD